MPKLTTHDKLSKLKRIPFTKEGIEKVKRNLTRLQNDRPAAVKELARARELGDLSENGLYTAAKARLSSIDNQIFRLEMTMKFADVMESGNSNEISIGSKVTVHNGREELVYEIVGDTEANPKLRKITQNSPIGTALLGKKIGETATVELPAGKTELVIKKIS
ncbi:MAG: transcription elongation factor GreA [Candidatus Levyibacteriota bacterium]